MGIFAPPGEAMSVGVAAFWLRSDVPARNAKRSSDGTERPVGRRFDRGVRSSRYLGALAAVLIALVVTPRTAGADKVDRLVIQLRSSKSYKVRLAAAVNLAKIADPRAIPPFVEALDDNDKNIRGLAATSLGKLITAATKPALKQRAIRALTATARRDKSTFVRKQAEKAIQAIEKLGQSDSSIYVNIGAMAAKTDRAAAMSALMRRTAEKAFAEGDTSMSTTWPGGKTPTARDLRRKGVQAFHVDGTLLSLQAQRKGSSALVSCKVSMLVATFPKKSMFGFLDGGARVQTGSAPRDIQYAKEDCISAVVEDLIAKKIIPAIRTRTNSQTTPRKSRQRKRRSQR
ncbi:MAG: HEAT repeat domain-containing protein [Proteobacteria bacterium]|nr:HEAT repeat domain-containing protein [Pseudomonadota bacterium]